METPSNTSSHEELLQLRAEGRITEAEYQHLLTAMENPVGGECQPRPCAEPQFEAFRQRILTAALAICVIGLPAGFALHLPIVWILSIVGLIVAPLKLSRMRGSWLARILADRKKHD